MSRGCYNRRGVSAAQAYSWLDRFLEGGRKALPDKRRGNERDPLKDENCQLKELVVTQALALSGVQPHDVIWFGAEDLLGQNADPAAHVISQPALRYVEDDGAALPLQADDTTLELC